MNSKETLDADENAFFRNDSQRLSNEYISGFKNYELEEIRENSKLEESDDSDEEYSRT